MPLLYSPHSLLAQVDKLRWGILPQLAGMGEGKCSWDWVTLERTCAYYASAASEQEMLQHSSAGLLKSASTGGWDTPLLPD